MDSPAFGTGSRLRQWARRIKRDGVALWFACRHPGTPWWVKALCAFVVAYALSPIDLIPDFIPVLGYVDDVLLLPALIWLAVRLMPAPVMAASRDQAVRWLATEGRKPRSRWGVALVVVVWMAIAYGCWVWISGAFPSL
ncbi:YkvA family protein [Cupriavidus campinensis]